MKDESLIQGKVVEKKIFLFTTILLFGFLISAFAYHFASLILHLDYPNNTFLFEPARAGGDFFETVKAMTKTDFYSEGGIYFPGCLLFGYPFTLLNFNAAYVVFSILLLAGTYPFVFSVFKRLRLESHVNVLVTTIFVFLSYPMLFCLDRGNFEGLSFLCFIGFVCFWRRDKVWMAAAFLGLAAATKLYPIVFGALLLRDKKWRPFLFACLLAALVNLVPAAFLPGGIVNNFLRLMVNQHKFNDAIGMTYGSVPFGLSLFSWVKLGIYWFTDGMMPSYAFTIYSFPCAMITLYCFYFSIRRIRLPWEAMFFVFAPWLVFPQISYDYKLIWLLVPACLTFEDDRLSRTDIWLFALLLIPKTLVPIGVPETSGSVILDPLLILIIAVRIYLRVIKDPHLDSPSAIDS